MKEIKKDNHGFTFIELLISITILAFAIIPLVNIFVTGSRTNLKSRKMQNATTLGQNAMEGLKKLNMTETLDQFNGLASFQILDNTIGEKYEADASGQKLTDVSKRDPGKYYFVMKNVQEGAGKYDIKLEFDANEYSSAAAPSYNDYKMPEIADLNGDSTAIVEVKDVKSAAASFSVDEAAYQLSSRNVVAVNSNPSAGYQVYARDEIKDNLQMKIQLNINQDTGGNISVEGNIIYDLSLTSPHNLSHFGTTNLSVKYMIYTKEFKKKVENIYIMYTPYSMNGDVIEVNCPAGTGLPNNTNFYIAKQDGTVTPTEVKLNKKNDVHSNLSIFSNLDSAILKAAAGSESFTINSELVTRKAAPTVSIYKYSVDICEAGTDFQKRYASFESTREENE